MLAFGRDVLSPLLNLGWFVGCLFACWCIGRPYRVAPWSLALGAIALSVPALADQAGEARNDIVGIFFLLAAVAIALNGGRNAANEPLRRPRGRSRRGDEAQLPAPGDCSRHWYGDHRRTGMEVENARSRCARRPGGGGYWYLRNLAHAGNPLPWVHHLGPIDLPSPEQALGGREAHSVLGYLTDGTVWSDWFLPGLHGGLWIIWPLLLAALAGLVRGLQFRGSFVRQGGKGTAER